MKAWITARRIKPGNEQKFRHLWAGNPTPKGMTDAYLLEDDEHPGETLSVSLWQDAAALRAYRESTAAAARVRDLAPVVDTELWSRSFDVRRAPEVTGRGAARWLLLPALLGLGGAGAFLARSRRREQPRPVQAVQAVKRRPTWLAVPAALAAAGAGGFLLVSRLRRGGDETPHDGRQESARPYDLASSGGPPDTGEQWLARTGSDAETRTRAERASGLLVRDVMTADPETIDYDAGLDKAAEKMRELNVGVLPVLADGSLAGMITDRDLALATAEGTRAWGDKRVRDVMSEMPVTISPHMSVEEAARLMAERQIRRLPVVEGATLVGIVALGDLAADADRQAAGRALEEISEPARPQR